MHWSLLFAMCLVALVTAAPKSLKFHSSTELEEEWKAFKINFGKTYKDATEEIFRKKIFAEHLETIKTHNRLHSKGLKTFTMGINRFSDLDKSEVVKLVTGYKPQNPSTISHSSKFFAHEVNASYPDEVDWRSKGYVTPVKNQGTCGGCWAFSTTGTLEGQHFRQTGNLVSLSEQQLIDCSTENHGCDGGVPYLGLSYIANNGGIDTEDSYPFEGVAGPCRFNPSSIGATCTDYVNVPPSEEELQAAVAEIGPISVGIDASQDSFHAYTGGIYDDPNCSSVSLDHAVLVVGYGTDSGQDYWIVKNSWGAQWGMDGYILMSRNNNNQCGIANVATYPEV